jgi:TAG lipase/steryl ester hydrolase/phospholipase A2/LPA acyltransferase
MIQNPSYAELQKAANQGRRCTWEKLSAIRANCAIELALDECVALLNHLRRLKRSAERASASQGHGPTIRLCPSRRIPSWNLIARENSTGSLDEEMLASPTLTNPQGPGAGGVAALSNRNHYLQRIAHDSSDSESESIDLNSWTRSGGPLMRTTSANKFISFVQNLEIDTEFRAIPSREDESDLVTPKGSSLAAQAVSREAADRSLDNSGIDIHDTTTPRMLFGPSTSIVVSEGDLLQPEKTENGILFNVVRRDTLIGPSSGVESQGSPREPDVETVQTECLDGVSASDDDNMELNDVNDEVTTDTMSRHNLQHQGSLEENVDYPSSLNCEGETNTNNSEAASIFDI